MAVARFDIEKFDGTGDFGLWRAKMKAVLVQQKVVKAIMDPSSLPENLKEDEKQTMQDVAHSTLILNLSDNVLRQVIEEESAHKIWMKLESIYLKRDLSNKIYLRERLFTFKMDTSKSLGENLDGFKKMVMDFNSLGEKLGDETEAIILLNSVPDTYKDVKSALKYGRESISVDVVISALKTKDLELQVEKRANQAAESLYARGRNAKQNNFKGKSNQEEKSSVKRCFLCKKEGHFKKDCYYNRKNKKKWKGKENSKLAETAVAEDVFSYAEVLAATDHEMDDLGKLDKQDWVLDSGCTYHMTPDKDWFQTYEVWDGGLVYMGNNNVCQVVGIGNVMLKLQDESKKILQGVRHVPKLKRNLISLGMLDSQGCQYNGKDGTLEIKKGQQTVLVGEKSNGLYIVKEVEKPGAVCVSATQGLNKGDLWHKRLAHISSKGLMELSKQGLLP